MMRLSPQAIDRLDNQQLDREERMYSLGGVAGDYAFPLGSPERTGRHGWKPTLDDIERRTDERS